MQQIDRWIRISEDRSLISRELEYASRVQWTRQLIVGMAELGLAHRPKRLRRDLGIASERSSSLGHDISSSSPMLVKEEY